MGMILKAWTPYSHGDHCEGPQGLGLHKLASYFRRHRGDIRRCWGVAGVHPLPSRREKQIEGFGTGPPEVREKAHTQESKLGNSPRF